MNTLLKLFLPVLFFLTTSYTNAQSELNHPDYDQLMIAACKLNSTVLLDRIITTAEDQYVASNDPKDLVWLCHAYYARMGICISKKDQDTGEKMMELGIAGAEKLMEIPEYESMGKAIEGGLLGMSIAFSPMKGMFRGPKSTRLVKKSLELDPDNAFAWLQKGSSEYNTPKIFGGSISKSIKSFETSLACLDKNQNSSQWLRTEVLLWLGQAQYSEGNYKKAHDLFSELLTIAPNHLWVEKSLLPQVMKKLKI